MLSSVLSDSLAELHFEGFEWCLGHDHQMVHALSLCFCEAIWARSTDTSQHRDNSTRAPIDYRYFEERNAPGQGWSQRAVLTLELNTAQTQRVCQAQESNCRDAGSPRYGKSLKAWSKYMKGACCLFAGYACPDRRVIVLTNPPPNIYSKRACSNYRDLEEPILKGVNTNRGTTRIDFVHPTVSGAAAFHYQVWPLNKSSDWFTFLKELAIKGVGAINTRYRAVQGEKISKEEDTHGILMLTENDGSTNGNYIAIPNAGGRQILEMGRAHVREAVKREMVEVEHQALTKKDVKRRKVEMEQNKARERKEAKRKEAEMEQKEVREEREKRREA